MRDYLQQHGVSTLILGCFPKSRRIPRPSSSQLPVVRHLRRSVSTQMNDAWAVELTVPNRTPISSTCFIVWYLVLGNPRSTTCWLSARPFLYPGNDCSLRAINNWFLCRRPRYQQCAASPEAATMHLNALSFSDGRTHVLTRWIGYGERRPGESRGARRMPSFFPRIQTSMSGAVTNSSETI